MRTNTRILALVLASVAAATAALAVDGVIEINQSRALAGGVTAGDAAGFPVSLNTSGSYRLTSNLTVPAGTVGIIVGADHTMLDLNGFNLFGTSGTAADGIQLPARVNVEIMNGSVIGFSGHGISSTGTTQNITLSGLRIIGSGVNGVELTGSGNLVDRCSVLNNGANGVHLVDGSLVVNSVVRGNGSVGLNLGATSGYRSCVLTSNNGSDLGMQVGGGVQLEKNVCGADLVCP